MREKRIVVPDGMFNAAHKAACEDNPGMVSMKNVMVALESAIRWLSENPLPLTTEMYKSLKISYLSGLEGWSIYEFVWKECQRRVFLAEEVDLRRAKIVEVLKQYPDRAPEIADKILAALEAS